MSHLGKIVTSSMLMLVFNSTSLADQAPTDKEQTEMLNSCKLPTTDYVRYRFLAGDKSEEIAEKLIQNSKITQINDLIFASSLFNKNEGSTKYLLVASKIDKDVFIKESHRFILSKINEKKDLRALSNIISFCQGSDLNYIPLTEVDIINIFECDEYKDIIFDDNGIYTKPILMELDNIAEWKNKKYILDLISSYELLGRKNYKDDPFEVLPLLNKLKNRASK